MTPRQDQYVWICTSQHCGRSYPEDGYGLMKKKDLNGNNYYVCSGCGGHVELHEIKRTNMPTGTLIKKGQQS